MSKVKSLPQEANESVVATVATAPAVPTPPAPAVPTPPAPVVPTPPAPVVPPPNPRMSEEDRLNLELAKSRRETAMAQAKEAVAKSETAELAHRYVVLQIYVKYGLNANDVINENGEIVKGGAVATQQVQVR
jgi:hypothetical protein